MAINIFNILKCLFWRQLKVQRYNELIVSLAICGILWLFVHREETAKKSPKSVDAFAENEETHYRFELAEDVSVYYSPVTSFTRDIMSVVCKLNCNDLGRSGNITQRMSSSSQSLMNISVTFHGNSSTLSDKLNFTVNYTIKNPRAYHNQNMDQPSNAAALHVQKLIQQRYMDMLDIPWRNYGMNVSILEDHQEEDESSRFLITTKRVLDERIVKTTLFKFAFIFILKTVKDVMQERSTMMKHMTILCNVPELFIWIGHIIQRMITNVFIAFVIALILKDYQNIPWYTIWGFLTLFCLSGIVQGFFFACITEDYNLNMVMMTLSWFLVYPLYAPDMKKFLIYCLCPGFALQLGYQVIDDTKLPEESATENGSFLENPFEGNQKPRLVQIVAMLFFDVIWMSAATYVFNKMRINKYGTTWCFVPIYFILEFCCELCGVEAFEQSQISLLPQYPNEKAEVGTVAVSLVRVYKVYRFGIGPKRQRQLAVRNFSIDFEKNTNTVILSQHYGGISTLMNMMAGITFATIGRVIVNGTIGYCAQENIHCADLSILDLVTFFGMLRGFDTRTAKKESTKLLLELNLFDYCDGRTADLQKSQHRKLSIALAVIGDVDILLIDEPTEGVNKPTQHEIWSFLLKYRNVKTLIISTKDTLEAEVLGERLAVVSRGMLLCYGSPWYIKGFYRYGYTLTVVCLPAFNSQRTQELIKKYVAVADVIHDMSPVFIVAIPILDVQRYPALFDDLDANKANLGIATFHLEPASMEDVFSATSQNQPQSPATPTLREGAEDRRDQDSHQDSEQRRSKIRVQGKTLAIQRFNVLLTRKFAYMLFKWLPYLIVLAGSITSISFAINHGNLEKKVLRQSCIRGERIKNAIILRLRRPDFQSDSWTNAILNTIAKFSDNLVYYDSSMNAENLGDIPIDATVFQLSDITPQAIEVKLMRINRCTKPILYNLFTNIVLRSELDEPPIVESWISRSNYFDYNYIPMYWCPIIGLVFSFAIPLAVSLPLHEKNNMFKQQLRLAGVSRFMYWCTNFVGDIIYYIVYSCALMLCIISFDSDFTNVSDWAVMFILMLFFSAVGCMFTYVGTFYFTSKAHAYVVTFMIFVVSVAIPGALFEWQSTIISRMSLEFTNENSVKMKHLEIEYIFCKFINIMALFIPPVAFNQGLHDLFMALNKLDNCNTVTLEGTENCDKIYNRLYDCCALGCQLEDKLICPAKRSFFMSCENGILISFLFLLLDIGIMTLIVGLFETRILHNESYEEFSKVIIPSDPEVIKERDDVEQTLKRNGGQAATSRDFKLLVSGIHKRYGGKVGAAGLTFGVESKKGFALLGKDGSGKTTALRILSGAEIIFGGDAYIGNYSLTKNRIKYLRYIAHCPQTDPANDALTVAETFDLLMAINGIQQPYRQARIDMFIQALKLEDCRNNKVCTLNDDSRRKLSFAQALVAGKDFMMLDEPTTGMTQQTRRLIWHLLTRYLGHGGTVLLASPSLIECEALCSRVAFMYRGQIEYIGTKTSLTTRFGKAFSIFIKLRTIGTKQSVMALKREIEGRFKVNISDEYPEFLCYRVAQVDASLSDLFIAMEQMKKVHRILEEYNISEIGLHIAKDIDVNVKLVKVRKRSSSLLADLKIFEKKRRGLKRPSVK